MTGAGAGEYLRKFRNQGAGDGPATDDDGEGQPEGHAANYLRQLGEEDIARRKGHDDGHDGGNPDQIGQGMFEVEFLLACEKRLAERVIHEIGGQGGQDHEDTHGEDPDDQLAAHGGIVGQGQGQKSDQGYTRNTVSLETVCRGADAVTGVVACTVGDDAGIFGIVFGKVEDDLHEVGTDVGDLGEDTTADTQGAGAEGLTDGEADKAGAGHFGRDVGQDENHEQEFDADQQEAHAHTGAKTDIDDIQWFTAQGREGGPGVGDGVDPDAEPGDAVGTKNSHNRAEENNHNIDRGHMGQGAEIINHTDGNQHPQAGEKFTLLQHIGLTGLPDGG